MMLKKIITLCTVLLLAPVAAHADYLFVGSQTGECCFNVDLLSLSSTEMQVTVTLTDGATFFANTGSGQHPAFAFNLSGDPTVTINGFNTSDWTLGGSVITGGPSLGTFDYSLDLTSPGTSGKLSSLTFDVTGSSPITYADFTVSNDDYYFVADILGSDGGTGLSGISTPGHLTPEPSSLLLLGTGIVGIAFLLRKRMVPVLSRHK